MKEFAIDQVILSNGNYRLNKSIVYFSPRYNKKITVPEGRISDGATGAMDITSRGWWIHDELCNKGMWDDGTLLSNWDCSQVLQDVLVEEGRYWQSKRWFWATWLFGGGQARKNGMLSVAMILLTLSLYSPALASEIYMGVFPSADNGLGSPVGKYEPKYIIGLQVDKTLDKSFTPRFRIETLVSEINSSIGSVPTSARYEIGAEYRFSKGYFIDASATLWQSMNGYGATKYTLLRAGYRW